MKKLLNLLTITYLLFTINNSNAVEQEKKGGSKKQFCVTAE